MNIKLFNDLVLWTESDIPDDAEVKECDEGWIIHRGGGSRAEIAKGRRKEYQRLKMREYRKEAKVKSIPKTAKVWAAYAWAYKTRYSVPPVRNARVNAQLAQFVDRVGAEEAPGIATYYVSSSNFFYTTKGHPVGLLLLDAEKLRTEFVTGNQVSNSQARQMDKRLATKNAFQKLLDRVESGENEVIDNQ